VTVSVQVTGLEAVRARLSAFSQRRFNATVATAMTRTVLAARDAVRGQLSASIDRPTPYTVRGLFVRTASAQRLTARLWYGDEPVSNQTPQSRYLYPQVHGGGRKLKRFELALQARGAMPKGWFAIPGPGAKMDGYGNVQRGQIQQILSQLGTELVTGYSRTLRQRDGESGKAFKRRKQRAFGKAGGQYVGLPDGRGKLPPGVYIHRGRDFGAKMGYGRTGKLTPVLFYVRSVGYRSRFPFYERAQAVVDQQMPMQLERAIAEQTARLASATR
jgi:hypothetical protein